MLDAPEATSCDGGSLRAFRQSHGRRAAGLGCEAHCAGGEGPGEALEDGRHGWEGDDGDKKDEEFGNRLQFDGCDVCEGVEDEGYVYKCI